MFGLGAQELMLILLIALVLFGGSKIPEVGRSLGQAIREFKRGCGDAGRARRAQARERPRAGRTEVGVTRAGLGRRECLTPGRPRL